MLSERNFSSSRDIRVLVTLYEQKIATADQIRRICFTSVSAVMAYRTLCRLKRDKFIDSKKTIADVGRPASYYFLTNLGYNYLRWHGCELPDNKQLSTNSANHDLHLTDLRILFSALPNCKLFLTENVLKSKILEKQFPEIGNIRSVNCDAAALIQIDGANFWYGIEYEQTRKSDERYLEKFKKWYQNTEINGIFYVVKDNGLLNILIEHDKKVLPNLKRKIIFTSFEDCISSTESITFHGSNGKQRHFSKSKSAKIIYPSFDPIITNSFR